MTASAPEPHDDSPIVQAVAPGYEFEGTALELGGLMLDATTLTSTHIRIPLGMLNRHGLVAGATGTGKTKTLQLAALLDEDSTFYGDLFAHVVEWQGEYYLEDGLHRALRAALQQRNVLHARVHTMVV